MMKRLAFFFICLVAAWIYALPKPDILTRGEISPIVTDRNGLLLRAFTSDDGRRRMATSVKSVDPLYIKMLIAYEDRRFYTHFGVDPLAILRAGVKANRVTSGASTLSMQTARLIEGENTRSFIGKLQQMRGAIALERHYSKAEILDIYLTLAPFGGNLEGTRAASLAYFGKEPLRLSPSEAALLVALPQSPESRRPDRAINVNIQARNRVLAKAYAAEIISLEEFEAAKSEALPKNRNQFPFFAAHYAEKALGENRTQTTLDLRFQARLESLIKEHVAPLDRHVSAAVIVIDNATGETRASIGGVDYFDKEKAGAVDLTRAVRSPGSALKPFIYGMAFDMGAAHPETMLEDRPTRYGLWAPENFDQGFTGAVTARVALQQSLNLPAVELLSKIGVNKFLNHMKQIGVVVHLPKSSEGAGLAVGLGGLGVTLADLTQAYAKIAKGEGAFSPAASWYLADILKDAPPPVNAPQGMLAFKTGTSYGYRDAWAFGFDRRHTIGVWVGRADNASVNGLVGRLIAAPLLFDAFKRIGHDATPFPKPADALVAKPSQLPPPLRGVTGHDFKLLFPLDNARFEVDSDAAIPLKVTGGVAPYFYRIDDEELIATTRKEAQWQPQTAGFSRVSVVDSAGISISINVRVVKK
jgi:penicillin-binding protein 1C